MKRKEKIKRFEEIINMLHLDNDIIEYTDEKWYLCPFDIWFYPKDPKQFYFVIDEIAKNYAKPYLGEGDYIDDVFATWYDAIDKDFLQMYNKAVKEYNIEKIKKDEKKTQMKIKITEDEHEYIEQMFGNTMKNYNYLKTDILLYLLYGEGIRWTYFEEDDTFYIKRGSDLVDEISKSEWKQMMADNSISIDKKRTSISIKTEDDNIETKFFSLLDELGIKYEMKNKNKLNQIISGDK